MKGQPPSARGRSGTRSRWTAGRGRRCTMRDNRGFTLLEVLISSALAGVVMVAVLSSFLFIGVALTIYAYKRVKSLVR